MEPHHSWTCWRSEGAIWDTPDVRHRQTGTSKFSRSSFNFASAWCHMWRLESRDCENWMVKIVIVNSCEQWLIVRWLAWKPKNNMMIVDHRFLVSLLDDKTKVSSGWWFQPLWKIWKSDWIIIPTIGKHKSHVGKSTITEVETTGKIIPRYFPACAVWYRKKPLAHSPMRFPMVDEHGWSAGKDASPFHTRWFLVDYFWLVVEPPTLLKNMSSSIGMMKFPRYGKIKHVPNHQPDFVLPEKETWGEKPHISWLMILFSTNRNFWVGWIGFTHHFQTQPYEALPP